MKSNEKYQRGWRRGQTRVLLNKEDSPFYEAERQRIEKTEPDYVVSALSYIRSEYRRVIEGEATYDELLYEASDDFDIDPRDLGSLMNRLSQASKRDKKNAREAEEDRAKQTELGEQCYTEMWVRLHRIIAELPKDEKRRLTNCLNGFSGHPDNDPQTERGQRIYRCFERLGVF